LWKGEGRGEERQKGMKGGIGASLGMRVLCGQRIQEAARLSLDDDVSVGSVDPEPEVTSGCVVNTFIFPNLMFRTALTHFWLVEQKTS